MSGKDCDYFEDKSVMNFEKMVFIAMDKSNYNSPEVIKRVFFQVRKKLNPESNKCLNKKAVAPASISGYFEGTSNPGYSVFKKQK